MADHDVEVFGNTITGNKTAAAGIISYALAQLPPNDPKYYQWPSNVYVHGNTYSGNGTLPDIRNQFGVLLATALGTYPAMHVPDVMYDGLADPASPRRPATRCRSASHEPTAVCRLRHALRPAQLERHEPAA